MGYCLTRAVLLWPQHTGRGKAAPGQGGTGVALGTVSHPTALLPAPPFT